MFWRHGVAAKISPQFVQQGGAVHRLWPGCNFPVRQKVFLLFRRLGALCLNEEFEYAGAHAKTLGLCLARAFENADWQRRQFFDLSAELVFALRCSDKRFGYAIAIAAAAGLSPIGHSFNLLFGGANSHAPLTAGAAPFMYCIPSYVPFAARVKNAIQRAGAGSVGLSARRRSSPFFGCTERVAGERCSLQASRRSPSVASRDQ